MSSHYILFLGLLHAFAILALCAEATPPPSCTCQVGRAMFKGCSIREPEEVWRTHYNADVGLHGDCLPQVAPNTVKCFRWRFADGCGPSHNLKCALRHRDFLDQDIATSSDRSQATLLSPGFNRMPQAYYNRNLCIYNISLDCPTEEVELIPTQRTTQLSDAQPICQDYLSFHVESQIPPLAQLCGTAVGDPTAYRTIPSSSFTAIFWTNDNDIDQGSFEILAKCRTQQGQGSGAGVLTPTPFQ